MTKEDLEQVEVQINNFLRGNWDFSEAGTEVLVANWFGAKKKLIDLLSKHPQWDAQNLCVIIDLNIERVLSLEELNQFLWWCIGQCKKEICTESEKKRLSDLRVALCNSDLIKPNLDEKLSALFNTYFPDLKISRGLKLSRAINKIMVSLKLNLVAEYNQKFAACADLLNPSIENRTFYLSVNPLDYLTMSNGNSWTSCHYALSQSTAGGYCAGTMSYMLDPCTMIAYTLKKTEAGEKELAPALVKKIQREVFSFEDRKLLQSRMYPQSCDTGAKSLYLQFRQTVQRIISECLETENSWVKTKEKNMESLCIPGSGSKNYKDWITDGYQGASCLSFTGTKTHKDLSPMYIGVEPRCISCGGKHSNSGTLYCEQCYSKIYRRRY